MGDEEQIVEEVARAIQANREVFPPEWETLSGHTQYHYRRMATAAIAAYRTEVERIGFCVCGDGPDYPAPDCGIPSHRAEARRQRATQ